MILFSCFLVRLPTVLEGSSVQDPPDTIKPPTTASIIDSVKLNQEANYFQEIPFVANNRVLETFIKISRIQCVLRCKQNKHCVDVAYKDDNMCLLLGRAPDGSQQIVYSTIISTVKFPGISFSKGYHV